MAAGDDGRKDGDDWEAKEKSNDPKLGGVKQENDNEKDVQWSGEGSSYVSDHPWYDPYLDFMKPLCQHMMAYVPSWMTANMMTTLSIITEAVGALAFFVLLNAGGGAQQRALAHLAMAVGVFSNHLLDDMDGMVARVRGQSSGAGEFLDHAADRLFFLLAYLANGYAACPAVASVLQALPADTMTWFSFFGGGTGSTEDDAGKATFGGGRGEAADLAALATWHLAYSLCTRLPICVESATGTYKMWIQLRGDRFRVCSSGEWFRLGTAALHLLLAMAYGLTPPMFGETGSANAVWLLQMALFLLSVFIATRQVVFQATRNFHSALLRRFAAMDLWVGLLHTGLLFVMMFFGHTPQADQSSSVLLDLSIICLSSTLHAYIIYRHILKGLSDGGRPSADLYSCTAGTLAWILVLPCVFLGAGRTLRGLEPASKGLATLGGCVAVWVAQAAAHFLDITQREARHKELVANGGSKEPAPTSSSGIEIRGCSSRNTCLEGVVPISSPEALAAGRHSRGHTQSRADLATPWL